ncbi:unnamed protein product [Peronospora destructor]|uniref:Uncharacterized protein n=1 Tax=Peronospora destructor TaxID=86335 RepID=A0AAV0TXL8_9STRA|nr:unnamed protein product [Peronospora destructor]
MTDCSDVTICLAEGGSTQCIVLPDNANDCPPCMYAIMGGGYSCYTRKNERCPFAPTFAVCEKSNSDSTPRSNSNDSTRKRTTKSTKAPAMDPAPAPETPTSGISTPETSTSGTSTPETSTSGTSTPETSTSGTSTPETSTPETSTSGTWTSETWTPETQIPETSTSEESTSGIQTPETSTDSTTNNDTSNYSKSITPGPLASPTTSTGSSATQFSDGSPATILSNTTTASSPSHMVASLALVGVAAVLVVLVILFIAHRVMKKKKKVKKLDRAMSMRDSHQSDGTLSSGASSANLYSTYRYKIEGGTANGTSMLTDSQANSTYGPDYADQTIHSGPSSRRMADFSSDEPHFSKNSRFYSVGTGMGVNGQQHYANNEVPTPLTQAGSRFVNVISSLVSTRSIGLDSPRSREHPLTVSQLTVTAAVGGHDEEAYKTRQKAGSLVYGQVPPRAFDSAISRSNKQFGASTASSMRSDYDIVDSVIMREVEVRNSEMLAQANCYPKFSLESEVSIYDDESSEEESSDDGQLRHVVEHTI